MDAVIVFYDILFLPQTMGAPLEFSDRGPAFLQPLRAPGGRFWVHSQTS